VCDSPFNTTEKAEGAKPFVRFNKDDSTVALESPIVGKPFSKGYMFDHVFGPADTQQELFETVVAPIVEEVLKGFNCTIFAYGQTGTGKTYTMEGSRLRDGDGNCDPTAGVIPRAIKLVRTQTNGNLRHSVCSHRML
jgi:kinesin family protein 11